jgi:hypothetical protein
VAAPRLKTKRARPCGRAKSSLNTTRVRPCGRATSQNKTSAALWPRSPCLRLERVCCLVARTRSRRSGCRSRRGHRRRSRRGHRPRARRGSTRSRRGRGRSHVVVDHVMIDVMHDMVRHAMAMDKMPVVAVPSDEVRAGPASGVLRRRWRRGRHGVGLLSRRRRGRGGHHRSRLRRWRTRAGADKRQDAGDGG